MVRVGGGWVALDEFLVKNDPCRGMYPFSYNQYNIEYFLEEPFKIKTLNIDLKTLKYILI